MRIVLTVYMKGPLASDPLCSVCQGKTHRKSENEKFSCSSFHSLLHYTNSFGKYGLMPLCVRLVKAAITVM